LKIQSRMKNKFCFVSVFGLITLLLLAPVLKAGSNPTTNAENPVSKTVTHKSSSEAFHEEVDSLYNQIDLKESGLSPKAFEYAYKGYKYLLKHHCLINSDVISICDFSQSSRNKRLYVVDLEQKKILINTYVAHGRKSGGEFARYFSNSLNSHKSSLGFYVTERTYYGDHGLALKIRGLERGFNDKAGRRNIVIHGSEYVGPDFISMNKFNGRSFGCPAVPESDIENLIETIKNGSCLFLYYPTKKYITHSKILNG
jgi:hypothetical protein